MLEMWESLTSLLIPFSLEIRGKISSLARLHFPKCAPTTSLIPYPLASKLKIQVFGCRTCHHVQVSR